VCLSVKEITVGWVGEGVERFGEIGLQILKLKTNLWWLIEEFLVNKK
jgi:hypothetical protein